VAGQLTVATLNARLRADTSGFASSMAAAARQVRAIEAAAHAAAPALTAASRSLDAASTSAARNAAAWRSMAQTVNAALRAVLAGASAFTSTFLSMGERTNRARTALLNLAETLRATLGRAFDQARQRAAGFATALSLNLTTARRTASNALSGLAAAASRALAPLSATVTRALAPLSAFGLRVSKSFELAGVAARTTFARFAPAASSATAAVSGLTGAVGSGATALSALAGASGATGGTLGTLAGVAGGTGGALSLLGRAAGPVGLALSAVASAGQVVIGVMRTVAQVTAVGFAAFATGAGLAVTAGLRMASTLEQAQIGFANMMGSAEQAKEFIGELSRFAARTPFNLPQLLQGARQLQALGFAAEDTLPTLEAVGDVVAGLALPQDAISGIVAQLGRMGTNGRVAAEEMMILTDYGIPAWDLLATKLGVTVQEARKLSEQGKIMPEVFISAFTAMEGPLERFRGTMAAQAKTLQGMMSTFQDEIGMSLAAMAKPIQEELTAIFPEVMKRVKGLMAGLEEPVADFARAFMGFIRDLLPQLAPMLRGLAGAFTSMLTDLGEILRTRGDDIARLFAVLAAVVAAAVKSIPTLVRAAMWLADVMVTLGGAVHELVGGFRGFIAAARLAADAVGDFLGRAAELSGLTGFAAALGRVIGGLNGSGDAADRAAAGSGRVRRAWSDEALAASMAQRDIALLNAQGLNAVTVQDRMSASARTAGTAFADEAAAMRTLGQATAASMAQMASVQSAYTTAVASNAAALQAAGDARIAQLRDQADAESAYYSTAIEAARAEADARVEAIADALDAAEAADTAARRRATDAIEAEQRAIDAYARQSDAAADAADAQVAALERIAAAEREQAEFYARAPGLLRFTRKAREEAAQAAQAEADAAQARQRAQEEAAARAEELERRRLALEERREAAAIQAEARDRAAEERRAAAAAQTEAIQEQAAAAADRLAAAQEAASQRISAAIDAQTAATRAQVDAATASAAQIAAVLQSQIDEATRFGENIHTIADTYGTSVGEMVRAGFADTPEVINTMMQGGVEAFRPIAEQMVTAADLAQIPAAFTSEYDTIRTETDRAMRDVEDRLRQGGVAMTQTMREGAHAAVGAQVRELNAGVGQVGAIANSYARTLADSLNPVLAAVGAPRIDVPANPNSTVGGPTAYAEGGIRGRLPSSAVIQPPTSGLVQWAEPETRGEAFIPLAPSKRARSVSIWAETGRRLGVPGFAEGGFRGMPGQGYAVGSSAPLPAALADTTTIPGLTAHARAIGARVTSAYRRGSTTYHGRGQAVDLSGGPGFMGIWEHFWRIGSLLKELFYTGAPKWIAGGRVVDPYPGRIWNTHKDHVHVATTVADLGSGQVLMDGVTPTITLPAPPDIQRSGAVAAAAEGMMRAAYDRANAYVAAHRVANGLDVAAVEGDVPSEYKELVRAAAQANSVRPPLLAGLIRAESGWRQSARSPAGAIGLTQLLPGTAREMGVDPTNPVDNIRGGARYLGIQQRTFGSEPLALAAYNAGPGAVNRYDGIPPYEQTQRYVPKVLGYAAGYADDFAAMLTGGILSAVPHLAKGGIAVRPTLSLIGEAGPEAVIPLARGGVRTAVRTGPAARAIPEPATALPARLGEMLSFATAAEGNLEALDAQLAAVTATLEYENAQIAQTIARQDLTTLEAEYAALPGQIAKANAELAKAKAMDAKVTAEEWLDIYGAQDAIGDISRRISDLKVRQPLADSLQLIEARAQLAEVGSELRELQSAGVGGMTKQGELDAVNARIRADEARQSYSDLLAKFNAPASAPTIEERLQLIDGSRRIDALRREYADLSAAIASGGGYTLDAQLGILQAQDRIASLRTEIDKLRNPAADRSAIDADAARAEIAVISKELARARAVAAATVVNRPEADLAVAQARQRLADAQGRLAELTSPAADASRQLAQRQLELAIAERDLGRQRSDELVTAADLTTKQMEIAAATTAQTAVREQSKVTTDQLRAAELEWQLAVQASTTAERAAIVTESQLMAKRIEHQQAMHAVDDALALRGQRQHELLRATLELSVAQDRLTQANLDARAPGEATAAATDKLNALLDRQGELERDVLDARRGVIQANIAAVGSVRGLIDASLGLIGLEGQQVKFFEQIAYAAGLSHREVSKLHGAMAQVANTSAAAGISYGVPPNAPAGTPASVHTGNLRGVRVVQDNLGKRFLVNFDAKLRWPITGDGQWTGLQRLYGAPAYGAYLTGFRQGSQALDKFGGPGGIERVIARRQPRPDLSRLARGAVFRRPTIMGGFQLAERPSAQPELVTPVSLMQATLYDALYEVANRRAPLPGGHGDRMPPGGGAGGVHVAELHVHFDGNGFDLTSAADRRRAALMLRGQLVALERERR